jgi:two-component system, OmpR family, alkaline phosphatase synthesis response regulator PhoP
MSSSRHIVLVAEDEPHLLRLVKFRLERDGYEVVTAVDGQCALDAVFHRRPDLCLLDVVMPRRSGWDVLTELRADERTSDIKVIMLTARASDADIQTGMRLGADDYLTKPFSSQDLRARVSAQLPG